MKKQNILKTGYLGSAEKVWRASFARQQSEVV